MGSVSLPTPLSPAVGSRKNAYRLACLHLFLPLAGLAIRICRPALAPVPDRCLDKSGGLRPVPTGLAACPQPGLLPWRLKRFVLQQAAPRSIDTGVHRSGCPMIDRRGLNGPGWCRPKAPLSLSYPAMMLSSRRVRFGFRLPVSAGDPGRRSVFALDELRMRRRAESGKGASVDLSTSWRNASGQGWISQRLGVVRETFSLLQQDSHGLGGLAVPLGEEAQAQSVQFDEACRIGLVVGAGIVLESNVRF